MNKSIILSSSIEQLFDMISLRLNLFDFLSCTFSFSFLRYSSHAHIRFMRAKNTLHFPGTHRRSRQPEQPHRPRERSEISGAVCPSTHPQRTYCRRLHPKPKPKPKQKLSVLRIDSRMRIQCQTPCAASCAAVGCAGGLLRQCNAVATVWRSPARPAPALRTASPSQQVEWRAHT